MELLHLTEAISNAPHAQQLTVQFANDVNDINKLLRNFNAVCSHVVMAQHTVADCFLQLAEISKRITCKAFAVQPKNDDFEQIGLQFSSMLEELSGLHRSFGEALRSSLFVPPHKLPSQPGLQLMDSHLGPLVFSDLSATQKNLDFCEHEVENALRNYMRLPKRCLPKQHDDAVMELSQRRCQFKKAAVAYTARLNATIFEKELIPLTAFHGLLTSLKAHTKRVSELTEMPNLNAFCETILSQLDCRLIGSSEATAEFLNTMTAMETQPLAIFAPEPLFSMSDRSYLRGPDTKLMYRSGYLFMRTKKILLTDWVEVYCYTLGGNLLHQQKPDRVKALGASVLVNLNAKGVFAEPVDIDDRRYTFQIVSAADKKTVVLQAENSTDRDEWIATITNVIAATNGLAVKENLETVPKSPQPFVLPGKRSSQSPMNEGAIGAHTRSLGQREEDDLMTAIRMSISIEDWLNQNPSTKFQLPILPSGSMADIAALLNEPAALNFKLTFKGALLLPEYLATLPSLLKVSPYILTKASEPGLVAQNCKARLTQDTVLFFASEAVDDAKPLLARFALSQIAFCTALIQFPNLLILLTGPPHMHLWKDEMPRGSNRICHLFETTQATEFAEAVLAAQLNRLTQLPEDGINAERNALLTTISHSEFQELSGDAAPLRSPPEAPTVKALLPVTASTQPLIPAEHILSDLKNPETVKKLPSDPNDTGKEETFTADLEGLESDKKLSSDEKVPEPEKTFSADVEGLEPEKKLPSDEKDIESEKEK